MSPWVTRMEPGCCLWSPVAVPGLTVRIVSFTFSVTSRHRPRSISQALLIFLLLKMLDKVEEGHKKQDKLCCSQWPWTAWKLMRLVFTWNSFEFHTFPRLITIQFLVWHYLRCKLPWHIVSLAKCLLFLDVKKLFIGPVILGVCQGTFRSFSRNSAWNCFRTAFSLGYWIRCQLTFPATQPSFVFCFSCVQFGVIGSCTPFDSRRTAVFLLAHS